MFKFVHDALVDGNRHDFIFKWAALVLFLLGGLALFFNTVQFKLVNFIELLIIFLREERTLFLKQVPLTWFLKPFFYFLDDLASGGFRLFFLLGFDVLGYKARLFL
jgi:hypothetical protein